VYLVTVMLTWGRTLVNALLAALSARPAAALLVTPKVRLYSAGPALSPDSVVDDYTAVTATGVEDVALTITGVVNLDGNVQGAIGHVDFVATTADPFVEDTAIGYILFDGTDAFYGGEQFASEVNFGQAGDFLGLDIVFPIGGTQVTNQE